jgi:hypothetical protein
VNYYWSAFTIGLKIYYECHLLLSFTDNCCLCTVSDDNYCRLLSIVLSVLRVTVIYCAFYSQYFDLLSFIVLVLSLLRITVFGIVVNFSRCQKGNFTLNEIILKKKNSLFKCHLPCVFSLRRNSRARARRSIRTVNDSNSQ